MPDAGYCCTDQIVTAGAAEGAPQIITATKKSYKQAQDVRQMPPHRGRIPKNLSVRERMERKLQTKAGHSLYKIRGKTVEPMFGTLKSAMGFREFMRRGYQACEAELLLMAAAFNLVKIFKSGRFQGCTA